jgi:hypothetical protein
LSLDEVGTVVQRSTFTEQQTRGEIDTQITTAKRFPRSITGFKKRAMELATLDEETAQSCFYALPRDGKSIEGPSARLAEIVAGSWGNLRSQANIVDEDDKFITARGVCWDLENNVAISVEVRRRITGKNGRRYNDDMIGTTANAACSIALRNAVFKVVPMAIVKPIYESAKRVAIGDATTLAARRDKALKHFASMGVRQEQIFAKLGRSGVEEITLDDLATLLGLSTAIKDGDTSIDEAFPTQQKQTASKGDDLATRLKAATDAKVEPTDLNRQSETYAALHQRIVAVKSSADATAIQDAINTAKTGGEITANEADELSAALAKEMA